MGVFWCFGSWISTQLAVPGGSDGPYASAGVVVEMSCPTLPFSPQPCGRSLNSILGKSNLKFAGMPITLTISTSSLNLMASDCKQVRAGSCRGVHR